MFKSGKEHESTRIKFMFAGYDWSFCCNQLGYSSPTCLNNNFADGVYESQITSQNCCQITQADLFLRGVSFNISLFTGENRFDEKRVEVQIFLLTLNVYCSQYQSNMKTTLAFQYIWGSLQLTALAFYDETFT